jgi:hypothetical protein
MGAAQAQLAGTVDDPHPGHGSRELIGEGSRPIGAAVVDNQEVGVGAVRPQVRNQLT